ncbi:MAG: diguanylate cyclase domain-containing protein [Giesbergeria sp.]
MRIGIAFRLGMLLASFSVLAASLAAYYTFDVGRSLLQARAESALLGTTRLLVQYLQTGLGSVSRDAQMLAATTSSLAPSAQQLDAPQYAAVADVFKATLGARSAYRQIRFIGIADHGLELVRVRRQGNSIAEVRPVDLHEQAYQPFFFEALSSPSSVGYVSEIGLAMQFDEGTGTPEAVFHVSMPVIRAGSLLGVLVVDVSAQAFLSIFRANLPHGLDFYLSNQRGDFLDYPDAAQLFGAEHQGERILIQERFGSVQALLDGKQSEQVFSRDDGSAARQAYAFARLPYGEREDGRFMVVGLSQPLNVVQQEVLDLGRRIFLGLVVLSLVAALLAALVSRRVVGPIKTMVRATQAFAAGRSHGALPVARSDELGELARSLKQMEHQIGRQLKELNRRHKNMAHLAHHDLLTGLPNRRMFERRLVQALAMARRTERPCVLLFIDLDDFKIINDTLGHAAGDAVLKSVAFTIKRTVRESDTVARLAGDEFTVLCENLDIPEQAADIAVKLEYALAQGLYLNGRVQHVRASVGFAIFPRDGTDIIELMAAADAAMYRIKQQHQHR